MHDLHCHTHLSSCAKKESTLQVMIGALKKADIKVAGIADHIWDSKVPGSSGWYAPQNVDHVRSIHQEYSALSDDERAGIKLYFGCETEYIGQGRVGMTPESAELFDFVLVPPHHFHMRDFVRPSGLEDAAAVRKLMFERFMECCNIDFVFGLAHPFTVLGYDGRVDEILSGYHDDDYREAFAFAKSKDKSIEINVSSLHKEGRKDSDGLHAEYRRMMTIARECGCKFHIGSDAHEITRLTAERFALTEKFTDACGIVLPEDPLNP